ncbi:MAG: hypothetical protein J7K75_06455 [Desulfuromonas sp.]|nr:hypothetical protein [Desulfuromonas sp.]
MRHLFAALPTLLLCSILSVLLSGCAGRPSPSVQCVGDCEQLLNRLQQTQYSHRALSALAEVKIEQGDKNWSSTQGLLVQQPNRLRFDAINFFGQLLFQMAVDGPRLHAYVPSERQHYTGDATLQNVQRFTGLPLAVIDLVALLLKTLPPGVLEAAEPIVTEQGLDLQLAPGVIYSLTFHGEQLVAITHTVDDYILYQVNYGEALDDVDFPRRIELRVPMNDLRVVLKLEDVELNPQLTAQRFQLTIPAGAVLTPLDEME